MPPSAICWSIWFVIPSRKILEPNRVGSISAGLPFRLRRTSQVANSAMPITPISNSAATASPPSCHTRMPSTMPPIPSTERTAPIGSTWRSPVYGASRTRLMLNRTTAMITTSSANPTRHERYVVMKPPSSGPTAAAIAAEAPTSA